MSDEVPSHRRELYRRLGDSVRVLSLETQGYVDDVARATGRHRSDVVAVGAVLAGSAHGGGLTPGELARRVNLSAGAVTALLDRLARAGHIRRRPHENDRRRTVVDATELGRQTSRTMFAGLIAAHERALSAYSDAELDVAARVLADLTEASREAHRWDVSDGV